MRRRKTTKKPKLGAKRQRALKRYFAKSGGHSTIAGMGMASPRKRRRKPRTATQRTAIKRARARRRRARRKR